MDRNSSMKMSVSSSSNLYNMPKRKVLPTVLNFMDGSRTTLNNNIKHNKSSTDIFDLLRQAINERRRIEVLTRDCRGIYGILIGWLIVFDKHMNLIMSDVDEVFRRLTDGQDYLELGPRRQNATVVQPETSVAKTTDITNDFQTFRAQLANFLRNKKRQPAIAKPPRESFIDEDENDEYHQPCKCHPESFLSMELLSINNLTVQRLSNTNKNVDSSLIEATPILPTSKRPKVRFFSRHIPKLFIKGNEVCLIRLLSS